ncbi:MAG: energy-coupling factor transporter ATP-binding protein EcfA2 [Myxococcota bacterium]|jgi:energy-coupling factor transporter ATP-binding protein EcfA2
MALSNHAPYVKRITIENFRPLRNVVWELPAGTEPAGWHVVIGDNGSGKTSLLKAVSLALLAHDATKSLRIEPGSFVGGAGAKTSCQLTMADGPGRRWDATRPFGPTGRPAASGYHASFGANRRFGGAWSAKQLEGSDPVAARHASLFDPTWALGDLVGWLKDLRLDEDPSVSGKTALSWVKTFVNQPGLLPDAQLIDVRSSGPVFRDGGGQELGIEALSDGYQSAVGLTLEVLRQLFAAYPPADVLQRDEHGRIVVGIPGLVLIDEVDAHLHPTWQQRIGVFFQRHFPRVQFLVTTHSPLVCRAAEVGTIYRLPRPGTDETGAMIVGQDRERLLFGDVLDAYGTEVFGADVTRGSRGQAMFDRLAELNTKARFAGPLSADETTEQSDLQGLLINGSGQ